MCLSGAIHRLPPTIQYALYWLSLELTASDWLNSARCYDVAVGHGSLAWMGGRYSERLRNEAQKKERL